MFDSGIPHQRSVPEHMDGRVTDMSRQDAVDRRFQFHGRAQPRICGKLCIHLRHEVVVEKSVTRDLSGTGPRIRSRLAVLVRVAITHLRNSSMVAVSMLPAVLSSTEMRPLPYVHGLNFPC